MRRLAVLLALLLLSACTTIPTQGEVERIPMTAEPRSVELAPEPPQPDMPPDRLAEGFLQAMAEPDADYAVARQYLTVESAATWQPSSGAGIYDGRVAEVSDRILLTGTRIGVLDAHGRHTPVADTLEHDFRVVQEDGQWRISNPPSGVMVSRYIFERFYAHPAIYFMARNGSHVVPELIHLPEALLTPARVVEALLAGPGPDLAMAVRNTIPPGTRLAPEGATISPDGVAQLTLAGLPSRFDESQRRELGAQLMWSLTAIPRVTGLQLAVDGVPYPLPGQDEDGVLELASQQGYQVLTRGTSTDLFGVRGGVAGRLTSSGSFLPLDTGERDVAEIALSLDAARLAFVPRSRDVVITGPLEGELAELDLQFSSIRSLQFASGYLWFLGRDGEDATQVVRVDQQGAAQTVELEIPESPIVDFSVSQTGARVALILAGSSGNVLGSATIVGDAAPRLEQWRPMPLIDDSGAPLQGYRSLDFSGESEIAVVAQPGSERPSVFLVRFDGSLVRDIGPLTGAPAEVSALPRMGGDALAVRSSSNVVFRYEARIRWSGTGVELDEISYPG